MSAIYSALLEKGVLYLGTQKESFRELTDPAQTEESLTIYKIIKAENPSIF